MAQRRPQGWWYPWTFVVGMLVVVAVNVVLITYAIGTFPGLDTEDAYRKGITYNQTLAAAHEQEARGWQADIQFHNTDETTTGTSGETGWAGAVTSASR
ncbi:MAG: FixH family protein [Defluviicoccus sp.]|nr:MAG: FixH family protein [Defluviicoccus sp.]